MNALEDAVKRHADFCLPWHGCTCHQAEAIAEYIALIEERNILKTTIESARQQLRATQRNWDGCLIECDNILSRGLEETEK